MLTYNSLKFLIFVVALLIVYFNTPKKYRWTTILVGNTIFFYSFSKWLLFYAVGATAIAYFGTLAFSKVKRDTSKDSDLTKEEKSVLKAKVKKKKKLIYLISLFAVLGFLVVLKYNNFISSMINPVLGLLKLKVPYKKFLIPIGISYYTLEMIAYMTDVFRKKYEPEKNPFKLYTFFTYFPKLLQGPISRYDEVGPQLFEGKSFDFMEFKKGWILVGVGFFKKLVIADRAGTLVDMFFKEQMTGLITIPIIMLYTIQLYTDFSGVMDIVRGVSQMFGINLPKNFKQPFFATNIQEFWRRWHMTLGQWLKDYVFYPISMSKWNMDLNMKVRKKGNTYISKFVMIAVPLFFVWLTMGIWHGASIKYVVYGLYYYILMMVGELLKPVFEKIIKVFKINTEVFSYKLFQIIRTIIIICFGMFIFRAPSLSEAVRILSKVGGGLTKAQIALLAPYLKDVIVIILGIFMVFVVDLMHELGINVDEELEKQNLVFKWLVYYAIIFAVLIFGTYGRGYEAASFIYGGF